MIDVICEIPNKEEKPICYNCGSELTKEEIERGEGICDDCNDPGRSEIR